MLDVAVHMANILPVSGVTVKPGRTESAGANLLGNRRARRSRGITGWHHTRSVDHLHLLLCQKGWWTTG